MEAVEFTTEATAGLITQGVLMALIPVILMIIWKIRSHDKVEPFFIGAAVWFIFAIILKIAPAYFLFQADNPAAKAINGSVWLSCLTAGILAGVFEETGRFLAFRFVMKKYKDRRSSITYGIGHGGFESIYIGFQTASLAVIGILISSGMSDVITSGADEATISALYAQLGSYTNITFTECMIGVFERLTAITAHIAFSVLVFAAVREKRYSMLFPASILLHALFDFSIVLYAAKIVPILAMEMILACFSATLAFYASRVYKDLRGNDVISF